MGSDSGATDRVLSAAARNCGEAFHVPGLRMGRPVLSSDLVIASDLGLPVPAPPNSATLLRPPYSGETSGLLLDLRQLFTGPGGGWQLFDLWASVDLTAEGFAPEPTPCMLRPPGGTAPARPGGLEVVEVGDDRTCRDMTLVLVGGFEIPGDVGSSLWSPAAFGDARFRAWVGYVDGRPVSTAAAYRGAGMIGVYAVATLPIWRGNGYGEAMSWIATKSAPDLPATLQASNMGQPIYERMGYQSIGTFTVWTTDTRS